jgi:hypothetical protein
MGRNLRVVWDRNRDLNCRFSSLFRDGPGVSEIIDRKRTKISYRIGEWILPRLTGFVGSNDKRVVTQRDIAHLLDDGDWLTSDRFGKCGDIVVFSSSRFLPASGWLASLRPVESIERRLAGLGLDDNTVGIHIRRGDNSQSAERSPLEAFLRRTEGEIARNRHVRFFLATDDPASERALVESYGSRVFSYAKRELSRSSPIGIEDALVDLIGLSRCRYIVGSYWSSFSEVASQIGRIPLEIATE